MASYEALGISCVVKAKTQKIQVFPASDWFRIQPLTLQVRKRRYIKGTYLPYDPPEFFASVPRIQPVRDISFFLHIGQWDDADYATGLEKISTQLQGVFVTRRVVVG